MLSLSEILAIHCVESPDDFSTPTEIKEFCNARLEANFSGKEISQELIKLGWISCGKERIRRDGKTCRFWFRKGNEKPRKLLKITDCVTDTTQGVTPQPSESLGEADRRFKIARADKEEALAIRRIEESRVASQIADHQAWKIQVEQSKYVLFSHVERGLELTLAETKIALDNLPLKLSARYASMTDENAIRRDMVSEINEILNHLCKGGIIIDDEKDVVKVSFDESEIAEVVKVVASQKEALASGVV